MTALRAKYEREHALAEICREYFRNRAEAKRLKLERKQVIADAFKEETWTSFQEDKGWPEEANGITDRIGILGDQAAVLRRKIDRRIEEEKS